MRIIPYINSALNAIVIGYILFSQELFDLINKSKQKLHDNPEYYSHGYYNDDFKKIVSWKLTAGLIASIICAFVIFSSFIFLRRRNSLLSKLNLGVATIIMLVIAIALAVIPKGYIIG